MNYKIVKEKGGTGFPESVLNKVINTLENEKISYKIFEKNEIINENNFKKINNYSKVLKKGISELAIEEKIEDIDRKIRNLSPKELNRIFDLIEDAISH